MRFPRNGLWMRFSYMPKTVNCVHANLRGIVLWLLRFGKRPNFSWNADETTHGYIRHAM